ncbi:uroporphyrinogen-III C-methyltransferase [Chitinimonas sp. PSY-7]|uniref:uroporphyrinogen-III C-methyltransferase n=1 Tax=Chitinimonas sp. PSY-7 TaxID=3459088 RepID=UPI0040402318
MSRPLAQRRFLITRPENQSATLAGLLSEAGAVPLLAPMIAIGESSDPAGLAAALQRLDEFDLAVFISPTALDVVTERVSPWPAKLPVAVIGMPSREKALELGMQDVISPDNQFDSEGLLAHPALQHMTGRRVVLFRGNGGREVLTETLRERGATVEVVEAYRRQMPRLTHEDVLALLAEGCDGVIVTSSEAVNNMFTLADSVLASRLRNIPFFASHAAIVETVRRHDVTEISLLTPGDANMVAELQVRFTPKPAPVPKPAAPVPSSVPPQPVAVSPSKAVTDKPGRFFGDTTGRAFAWVLMMVVVSVLMYQFQAKTPHQELNARLSQLEALQGSLSAEARRDGAQLRQLDARQNATQAQQEEILAQQSDLQALYGSVAGDHEEAALADAELTLSLASQQLQLTGNTGAVLAALYRLEERLAGNDKPRLQNLRRAVVRDIDQLKSVPWVDYVGLSARLDSLAVQVDKLPLLVDAASVEDVDKSKQPATTVLGELGRALGALVEIRRLDRPNPVLLAPEQAFYLREHLKLRLLNARLALLQRDESTFRLDLSAIQLALREQFDTRSKPVKAVMATLAELQAARPAQTLPTLADSVNAAREARRQTGREDSK